MFQLKKFKIDFLLLLEEKVTILYYIYIYSKECFYKIKFLYFMKNQVKIPVLFFLLFLISKEIFSHESEKIVIFCILTFIVIAYFNTKEMISNSFLAKSEQLTAEYNNLVTSKENLEKELKKF